MPLLHFQHRPLSGAKCGPFVLQYSACFSLAKSELYSLIFLPFSPLKLAPHTTVQATIALWYRSRYNQGEIFPLGPPLTRGPFSRPYSHVVKTCHSRLHSSLLGLGIYLSLIHISEPTRLGMISYAVFCLKKKK